MPTKAPTEAQIRKARAERAKRRAFDGAPPVIPHGVRQRTSASCLACHRKGALVNGKLAPAEALAIVAAFLATPFSGDDRHQRRIGMLADYEASHVLPELPKVP